MLLMTLKSMLGRVWPYIALIAAAFAAFFGIRQAGKAAGRQEVEREQTAQNLDALRKSNANREEVARMGDDAQLAEFDRLRDLRRKKRG